jgi:hypothetical protein
LLADELHDATSRGGNATAAPTPAASPASARRLEAIAERLENLATRLEG